MRAEDFTVHLTNIPLQKDDFENNPELLNAMLVTHLEEVVKNEP